MIMPFYGRVSTEEQAERGNIENQVNFARKYLELYGKTQNITDFKMYLDEGVSGTLPLSERKDASRLIADIKAGKYTGRTLYIYRVDRLARSVKEFLDFYDFLEAHGVALKSMTEPFDTNEAIGKFFMTLLASIAALERDTILERTQLGKATKAKEGHWTSGQPPFGYRIGPDKKLVIEDNEAETVRLIFRLYTEEGMTTKEVARYLNAKNIPTPTVSKGTKNVSTGKWHAGHISIILRNKVYTGEYETMRRSKKRKTGVLFSVPAIITKEVFDKAEQLLVQNADAARGSRGREYLLRGLIRCGNCGRSFVGSSGVSKQGRVYYRCTGTVDMGQGKRCNAKMIRAVDMEEAVWSDIQQFLKNPGGVVKAVERTLKKEVIDTGPVRAELEELENDLIQKQAARQRILSLVAKGIITEAEAENELLAIAGQIDILTKRQTRLYERLQQSQNLSNHAVNVKTILERLADYASIENKAEIIKNLVKEITVYTEEIDGKKVSRAVIEYYFKQNTGKVGLGLNDSAKFRVLRSSFILVATLMLFFVDKQVQGYFHYGENVSRYVDYLATVTLLLFAYFIHKYKWFVDKSDQ